MQNRSAIPPYITDALKTNRRNKMSLTKRQVEIVEQFEDSVYENMADQVYFNMSRVTDRLIQYDKEDDLVELARAFKVDDVTIKCGTLEEIKEETIVRAEQYIFEIIEWNYDKDVGTWRPREFEPPRGRKPKIFRTMHLSSTRGPAWLRTRRATPSRPRRRPASRIKFRRRWSLPKSLDPAP